MLVIMDTSKISWNWRMAVIQYSMSLTLANISPERGPYVHAETILEPLGSFAKTPKTRTTSSDNWRFLTRTIPRTFFQNAFKSFT